jgi:hypothetical protein
MGKDGKIMKEMSWELSTRGKALGIHIHVWLENVKEKNCADGRIAIMWILKETR